MTPKSRDIYSETSAYRKFFTHEVQKNPCSYNAIVQKVQHCKYKLGRVM